MGLYILELFFVLLAACIFIIPIHYAIKYLGNSKQKKEYDDLHENHVFLLAQYSEALLALTRIEKSDSYNAIPIATETLDRLTHRNVRKD